MFREFSRASAVVGGGVGEESAQLVRESMIMDDEDQLEMLTQTLDLLIGAGYFRAKILGLSNFDKVSAVWGV